MTIKQRIHNLFFGENERRQNQQRLWLDVPQEMRYRLFQAQLLAPDTTRVWGPDISPWDGNVNLSVTKSHGASFVFIKGLDGTIQVKYFADNRRRAIDAGLLQSPYQWLYRNVNVSCVAQAQAMSNLLSKFPSDLPAVIDFEWTKWMGNASNPTYVDLDMWATEFLRLGNRKPILYSAPGYFNPLGVMPTALKEKFSALWLANYAVSIPNLPVGFDHWDFWQFTDSGDASVYTPNDVGTKEVDLSYWNGSITSLYDFAGAEQSDVTHTQPYPGVDRYQLTVNNVLVVVEVTDMTGRKARVAYFPWLKPVSQYATYNGAQMAWNANPWDVHQLNGPWVPQGVCVADGGTIANDKTGVPVLNISKDGKVSIVEGQVGGLYNAISGFRMLVRNGQNVVPTTDPDLKYKELHARSGKGVTADGRLVTVTTDGIYPGSGLTLHQLADVFVDFGAVSAFDNDSGGSSTDYDEKLGMINTPADGHERAVICALLVYAEGEVSMARYEAVAIADGTRLRPDHNTNNTYINQYPKGTKFHGEELWVAPTDVYGLVNGVNTLLNQKGDKWLKVTDVNGVVRTDTVWVAIIHKGQPICTLVDNQPAVTKTHTIDVYSDGSLVIDGQPYL